MFDGCFESGALQCQRIPDQRNNSFRLTFFWVWSIFLVDAHRPLVGHQRLCRLRSSSNPPVILKRALLKSGSLQVSSIKEQFSLQQLRHLCQYNNAFRQKLDLSVRRGSGLLNFVSDMIWNANIAQMFVGIFRQSLEKGIPTQMFSLLAKLLEKPKIELGAHLWALQGKNWMK